MKGLLQSLEAVIGILLIMSIFVLVYSREVQLPELDTVNFKLKGFSALKTIDSTGELRRAVFLNDTTAVENKVSDLLPKQLNLKVVFCERQCALPDIATDRLISVMYIVSGNVNSISPRQVVLYMWLP